MRSSFSFNINQLNFGTTAVAPMFPPESSGRKHIFQNGGTHVNLPFSKHKLDMASSEKHTGVHYHRAWFHLKCRQSAVKANHYLGVGDFRWKEPLPTRMSCTGVQTVCLDCVELLKNVVYSGFDFLNSDCLKV